MLPVGLVGLRVGLEHRLPIRPAIPVEMLEGTAPSPNSQSSGLGPVGALP